MQPTSSTGELSAIYHALAWIRKRRMSSHTPVLVSESNYCVNLFAARSIKPVANKRLIARINVLLDQDTARKKQGLQVKQIILG